MQQKTKPNLQTKVALLLSSESSGFKEVEAFD
jgi:hypothetical protein